MDTTETNIKMCRKAWPDIMDFCKSYAGGDGSHDIFINDIWLPHQDQLQEMIKTDRPVLDSWYGFYKFVMQRIVELDDSENENVDLPSYEQLWLAFVMKEKFNKVWNGEDWVASV